MLSDTVKKLNEVIRKVNKMEGMKNIVKFAWHYWTVCPKCKHALTVTVDADVPRVASIRCPKCQEIICNEAFGEKVNKPVGQVCPSSVNRGRS
jgi:transposase-like protein